MQHHLLLKAKAKDEQKLKLYMYILFTTYNVFILQCCKDNRNMYKIPALRIYILYTYINTLTYMHACIHTCVHAYQNSGKISLLKFSIPNYSA